MNINKAIINGAKFLKKNFILTANLDAEILMGEVINKDRIYVILNQSKELNKENLLKFEELIKQRSQKKPISYLTNKKYFWNSEFFVTRDTLIPRSETELIVESVLKLSKNKNFLSILDIGVGSGCILLSILKEKQYFYGTGIDISQKCLNVCQKNANKLNIHSRLRLFKSDVDKFISGKYDVIVSNPPYINKYNIKYLEKDIFGFEPKLALDGGLDGLSEIRKVIKKASELIKKNGKFILEIGFDQKNKVIKLLKKEGFYINCTRKDLYHHDRCIVCTKI